MRCSVFGGIALDALVALVGLSSAGCAPLPPEPDLRGPQDERSSPAAASSTRELVWVKGRYTIRVTRGDRMCEQGSRSETCTRLSAADSRELERFFGADDFRARWARYGSCPTMGVVDSEIFAVTYADGEKIGKVLDAPIGSPMVTVCDRATRDAIASIRDSLMKRYMP